MKYSTKLSDAVHVLAFLALHPGTALTSERIAESVQTNPAYIRQLMSALRRAGLLASVKGHPRAALAREPGGISLLDVYRAIEGDKPILHQDTHTNPDCGVGVNIQLALRDYYDEVQRAAEDRMSAITLQDIIDTYRQKAGIRLYGGVQGAADEAVAALLAGTLGYDANVHCGHHDHEHGTGAHSCGGHTCGEHSCHG